MKLAFVADAQSSNTHSFVRPLVEQGHDVHLISLHHVADSPPGVTMHFLSRKRLLPKRLYLTRWPRVRKLIHEIAPDLVVAYRLTGNGLLAALTGWKPLVVVPTGTDILGLEHRPPAMRRIVRHVLKKADGILCWGPHMAAAAVQLRGPEHLRASPGEWNDTLPGLPGASAEASSNGDGSLLLIQPRGIDRAVFAPRMRPLPPEQQTVTLVTTRSLKKAYRQDSLIRAMMHLQGSEPRIRLVVAGGGADGNRLWELTSRLGVVDDVDFLGPVPHHEIPRILSGGSIYISLIDHDGVSASLLEAMSVGLYPIVGDSDAARVWIRDGWNGSLVKDDHPEPVARLIHRLCSKPSLREEVVKRNWRLVEERADSTGNSRRIADWFQEVVASHRHSVRNGRSVA